MPIAIHRTAMFTLPTPTQHARAALERAFRDYAHAYGTLLHLTWLRYGQGDDLTAEPPRTPGLDALRGLATYALDEQSGQPRQSARTLQTALFVGDQLPPRAREALDRLPSRLRQSAREHAGQSLMSYVALADAWLLEKPSQRGGAPSFPRRLRPDAITARREETLDALAMLADDRLHERALVETLLTTRDPGVPAIPFVGVADAYGCGMYYSAETASYYARLDIGAPNNRGAAPLAMRGIYTNIKTGERWAAESHLAAMRARGESIEGIQSFGRGKGRLFLPLKLDEATGRDKYGDDGGSYHQRALRFTRAAYLPVPGSRITPAKPVSAKLVRRDSQGKIWYQLHVSFEMPPEALDVSDGLMSEQRPILAINRGLFHLYAAAILTPDGRREVATFAAGGRELLARQAAMDTMRQRRQQRGKQPITRRDRRQSRIADHEIAVCANQIVEIARRERAQVVFEDMSGFAGGAAVRATRLPGPKARTAAFRALLNRRQFEALRQAVDQRLALVALPPTRVVSAAYISQTCTLCGARDARPFAVRREAAERAGLVFDSRQFTCPNCGVSRDVDVLAAVNVGRKLVWLRQRGAEKKAGLADGARTPWDTWLTGLLAERS